MTVIQRAVSPEKSAKYRIRIAVAADDDNNASSQTTMVRDRLKLARVLGRLSLLLQHPFDPIKSCHAAGPAGRRNRE